MIKKLKKLVFSRFFVVGFMIAVQFALILAAVLQFSKYFVFYYALMGVLAIIATLRIIYTDRSMAYKLAWIVVIFIFPAFGVTIYAIFSGNMMSSGKLNKLHFISDVTAKALGGGEEAVEELYQLNHNAATQSRYITNAAKYPLYKSCFTQYYKTGEEAFVYMLEELEKAEKYIFIEYFIIGYGEMWDKIREILLRKAKAGVDIRIVYDDIGSIMCLGRDFRQECERDGFQCRVFHRFLPVLSARQNNRDHRKILSIDGKVAFTGGINIADEYINVKERFGYWKDNAILVKGEPAWSFTVMFLTMWDYLTDVPEDKRGQYDAYKPEKFDDSYVENSFVQPYSDNPLDFEPVGENVYLGIISNAHSYLWITTPYLIIDEQMEQALIRAAKSGVDVRIVTPGIPDKKIVNETTKSFYPNLINGGVKIYEYTPGFIHSKTFLCDDKYSTVGSVNLDYRSLYLHFECGLWMYNSTENEKIKEDFEEMFRDSVLIKPQKCSYARQVFRGVLELLAPLQ